MYIWDVLVCSVKGPGLGGLSKAPLSETRCGDRSDLNPDDGRVNDAHLDTGADLALPRCAGKSREQKTDFENVRSPAPQV